MSISTAPGRRWGHLPAKLLGIALKAVRLAPIGCAVVGSMSHAAQISPTTSADPPAGAHVAADYGKLPLSFEANRGQTDASAKYVARGQGYALFLTEDAAVLELPQSVVRMHLLGARKSAQIAGEEPQGGSINYLMGTDARQWHTGARTFGRVRYPEIYPGVDLVYYGNQRQLEYDFIVAPGTDPARVALTFEGATARVDEHGDLALAAHGDRLSLHRPVVYQMEGNERRAIDGSYVVARNQVHFRVGAYDHGKALIIDPVLSYETYLGGNNYDYIGASGGPDAYGTLQGQGIAVDSQGNVYVAGTTVSLNFPLKNPYQSTAKQKSGYGTVFVTKLNPTGTAFVYSTFLGGSVIDEGVSIAVDAAGSAYVVGNTLSPDFPVTANAFQKVCSPELNNGAIVSGCGYEANGNAFVTKLSADGQSLVYSTFLGGDDSQGGDTAMGVAVDGKGQAYVVGTSSDACASSDPSYYCFPTTTGAFVNGSENGNGPGASNMHEGFLSVFNAAGSGLVYSTLLSHTVPDGSGLNGAAVALDPAGNIYIAGTTNSGNLSTTVGAFQTTSGPTVSTNNGAVTIYERALVAKFSPVGGTSPSTLMYLTYLGGTTTTGVNYPTAIAADASGSAYVFGPSSSESDLPTTAGAYQTTCGGGSAYLAKLNPTGSALAWATCFGGASNGTVSNTSQVVLDAKGNVYIAGSGANNLPQVNPIQSNNGGTTQAFIAELDPTGSKLLFSTLVGDGGALGGQYATGLAIDAGNNLYLAGQTYSNDLPVTAGAAQSTYGGGAWDGFIARIAATVATTTTVSASSASVVAGSPVTLTATVVGPTGSAAPTGSVAFMNGGTTLGTQSLNGTGTAVYTDSSLPVGTDSVTAVYAGDTLNAGSTSAAVSVTVTPAPVATSTKLTAAPATAVSGTSVTLTATVSPATGSTVPTGTVTFAEGSTTLGTGALGTGGIATFTTKTLSVGAHAITASYGGDAGDTASVSAVTSVTVTAAPTPDFALTLSPASATVAAGKSSTTTVSVAPSGGFAAATTLACSGLPTYATCSFSAASLTPSGTAAATSTLTIATNVPATVANRVGIDATSQPTTLAGILATFVLLPVAGRRRRKLRHVSTVGMFLVVGALSSLGLSGCGGSGGGGDGSSGSVTPAGTYTVTVTGTSGSLTHTATYTLTVQ